MDRNKPNGADMGTDRNNDEEETFVYFPISKPNMDFVDFVNKAQQSILTAFIKPNGGKNGKV